MTNTITSTELELAHVYLNQTRDLAIGATKFLSESQWKFKPAPDRWSIAENLEHMVTVQDIVLGPVRDQLKEAPAGPPDRDHKLGDYTVIYQFPVRISKFQGPDVLCPAGQSDPAALLHRLLENYQRLSDVLDSTLDLRQHLIEAAPMKAVTGGAITLMDGYQWILAAGAHTERHAKQILEVKADSNFPLK
jgi:hypothetical protein